MEASGVLVAMDYCVTDVWAVLPDRIVERATIIVEAGVIVSVVENGATTGESFLGHGSVCIPGIVDIHSDIGAETSTTEHGITTQLHALEFGDTSDAAIETQLGATPTTRDVSAVVDHRPLLCIDTPAVVDDVVRWAGVCAADRGAVVVSVAASTLASAGPDSEFRLDWFTVQAMARRLRLVVRGPATADDVDRAVDWGAAAIEYPVTIEAARRACERGLSVIGSGGDTVRTSGAPTAISPLALIELGLCDALTSENQPNSLLDAVSLLVLRGVCDLRSAVKLVTAVPAAIAGLSDRGRLAGGLRGDLVLLRPDSEHFRVRSVFRADRTAAVPRSPVG